MRGQLDKWMVSSSSRIAGIGFFRFHSLAPAVFALGLLLSLSGCHHVVTDPQDPKFIVAEGPGWTMTRAELNEQIATFLKQRQKTIQDVGPAKMPELESDILNSMVLKKLLLDRAAKLSFTDLDKDDAAAMQQLQGRFPSEKEFDAQLQGAGLTLDQVKKQIHESNLVRRTLQAEAFHDVEPSDAEINDFYLKNQDKLTTPEKIRASRIVIMMDDKTSPADREAKKKAIDKAHARVVKGEDFSKVATQVSEDRYSAPKGGDIGFFQRGENEGAFDDVAFSTKQGAVSPVFSTATGYEFLKVTDVHPGGVVSIAEARDTIAKYLRQMKQRQQIEAYTKNLLASSGTTFHLKMVDPTHGGATNSAPSPAGAPPQ
jgi:parvulin-like peptidyl-prolyl isomerase